VAETVSHLCRIAASPHRTEAARCPSASSPASTTNRSPAWANFFTRPQYDEFVRQVDVYFRRAGSNVAHDDHVARVTISGGSFPEGEFGLMNVAQICNMTEADEWPQRIADHFDSLVAAQLDREQFNAKEADFEQVKDLLMVRIGDEASLPLDILCFRRELPGDDQLPRVRPAQQREGVSNDLPKKWDKSLDELFPSRSTTCSRTSKPDKS
jgi:hypothetical protein